MAREPGRKIFDMTDLASRTRERNFNCEFQKSPRIFKFEREVGKIPQWMGKIPQPHFQRMSDDKESSLWEVPVIDQDRELLEAWRAVANAKLVEYRRQCWRLSLLVRQGALDKIAAIDRLHEIAIAHALVRSLGEDRIEAIIAEAFADVELHPMRSEFAA